MSVITHTRTHVVPTVSVITATYRRPEELARAGASVEAQTYPVHEWIVVGDGPESMAYMPQQLISTCTYGFWLPDRSDDLGATPYRFGTGVATGDLIAFLDDDNEWAPDHLKILVARVQGIPQLFVEAGTDPLSRDFAFSDAIRQPSGVRIGNGRPEYGHIDTSTILVRRELVQRINWEPVPPGRGLDPGAPDWWLVSRWLEAGATWAYSGQPTLTHHDRVRA